jgi:hypothetical protein
VWYFDQSINLVDNHHQGWTMGPLNAISDRARVGTIQALPASKDLSSLNPGGVLDEPVKELNTLGQSVWLDYIRRGLLDRCEFESMVREDGISGVTSNPAIFQKAIAVAMTRTSR